MDGVADRDRRLEGAASRTEGRRSPAAEADRTVLGTVGGFEFRPAHAGGFLAQSPRKCAPVAGEERIGIRGAEGEHRSETGEGGEGVHRSWWSSTRRKDRRVAQRPAARGRSESDPATAVNYEYALHSRDGTTHRHFVQVVCTGPCDG